MQKQRETPPLIGFTVPYRPGAPLPSPPTPFLPYSLCKELSQCFSVGRSKDRTERKVKKELSQCFSVSLCKELSQCFSVGHSKEPPQCFSVGRSKERTATVLQCRSQIPITACFVVAGHHLSTVTSAHPLSLDHRFTGPAGQGKVPPENRSGSDVHVHTMDAYRFCPREVKSLLERERKGRRGWGEDRGKRKKGKGGEGGRSEGEGGGVGG